MLYTLCVKIPLCLIVIFTLVCGYIYFRFDKFTVEDRSIESTSQDIVPVPILVSPKITSESVQGFKTAQFVDEKLGFSFTYRSNPEGYSVILQPTAGASYQNLLAMYSVMKTTNYNQMVQNLAQGTYYGNPTHIVVQVYDANGDININSWLLKNSISTNCEVDTTSATIISDKEASRCLWSGMYDGITVGLLFNDKVYILTGTTDRSQSAVGYSDYDDFNELVSSFKVF